MALSPTILLLLTIVLTSVHAYWLDSVELPSSRLYSLDTELCCNGTIYESNNSTDYECCGPKLINKTQEICCYPEVHPRQETTRCCGSQSYNSITHQCTSWIKKRDKNTLTTMAKPIVLPIDFNDSCGFKELKRDEEICCNYEVFANPDGKLACCESKIYDFTTHVCCRDEVVPKNKPEDNACCAGEPYNRETHSCARDVLVDKPKSGSSCGRGIPLEPSKEICCTNYDTMFVLTMSEPDHNSCCGNQSYSRTNHVCCSKWIKLVEYENQLYSKADVGHKTCCGTELIDFSHHCCRGESYDPKTHTCCFLEGSYVSKIVEGANAKCCGLEAMDPEKEECCGTSILAKSPEGKSGCCTHRSLSLHIAWANTRFLF